MITARVFGSPSGGRSPRSDASAGGGGGGGGTGGFAAPVDTIARATAGTRLVDLNATTFPDGTLVFVRSVRDFFVLEKASALTADNTTIANAIGGGQWLRLGLYNEKWLHQAAWFIDPAAADDEGDGSAVDPLRSHAELGRRAFNHGARITQSTTVTIEADLPGTDPIEIDVELPTGDTLLRYVGTVTSLQSGTLTAATALVSGTNLPDVTDAGLPGLLGRRIRLTSGASAGAIAWLLRADGGNTVTTSAFQTTSKTAQPISGTPTLGNPATNDGYDVEDLPQIFLARVKITVPNDNGIPLVFDSLEVGFSDESRVATSVDACLFVDSKIVNMTFEKMRATCAGVALDSPVTMSDSVVTLNACAVRLGPPVGLNTTFLGGFETTAVTVPLITDVGNGDYRFSGPVSAHDSPTSGIVLSAFMRVQTTALIWGTGNTAYGINARGGKLFYAPGTQPTITGGTNDTRVGGVDRAYAAIPDFNASNGACIADTPT